MMKRPAEDKEWGMYLKQKTKKAKEDNKRSKEEAAKKQREIEYCIAAGRVISMEDIKRNCLIEFKGILESKAEEGYNTSKIMVGEYQIVKDVSCKLFDWERNEIASWIHSRLSSDTIKVWKVSYTLNFTW